MRMERRCVPVKQCLLGGKAYPAMRTNSAEYQALMTRWSNEAFAEETARDAEDYAEHEDNYRPA